MRKLELTASFFLTFSVFLVIKELVAVHVLNLSVFFCLIDYWDLKFESMISPTTPQSLWSMGVSFSLKVIGSC